ncbi:hypothetical protein BX600DRAFT_511482 [Xylariales sp. PMI_506]|nr:hypothetical protein BX600DRAFT_511482 [Xylariales sp. PMI_506]
MAALRRVMVWFSLAGWHLAIAFSWKRASGIGIPSNRADFQDISTLSAAQVLLSSTHPPAAVTMALNELEQLESAPLCHQTAARLLVNNCQLLEHEDDPKELKASGRRARDFVDAYAASLAICDLERGSFAIPGECTKFRESALNSLLTSNGAQFDMTPKDIDECLSSLAASDSAWNTWVNYRHKALLFCEAARADNEKAAHINLFRRLAKIMNSLTEEVEARFDERLVDLDNKAQIAIDRIESLPPLLDRLKLDVDLAEEIIAVHITKLLQNLTRSTDQGFEDVDKLRNAWNAMAQTFVDTNSEASLAYQQSLQVASENAMNHVAAMVEIVSSAIYSASALHQHLESSHLRAAELEYRQENLEEGMQRLVGMSEDLSWKYESHTGLIEQAYNITNELLDTLEDTTITVATVGGILSYQSSTHFWWPYILCPAVSLVMGSYGLPPSVVRNLALVALGEVVAFAISSFQAGNLDIATGALGMKSMEMSSAAAAISPNSTESYFD